MNQEPEINSVQQPSQNQVIPEAVPQNQANEPEKVELQNEVNWRKFREQREIERKQKDEAERIANEERAKAEAMKAALDALLNKPTPQQSTYGYEEETEEQKIDKRVNALLAQREQEYERQRQEKERTEFPQKLNSTFQDFNQVCSTENLDYLEYHYPEVAQAYKQLPDSFDKWAGIYKALKRFVPNIDGRKEAAKADKNFNKPQSMGTPTTTQEGKNVLPNRISDEKKAENWKRMQAALKGLS